MGASGLKSELTGIEGGASGFRNIVLSGFGKSRGRVYSDPALIAHHSEIFSSEKSLRSMRTNATNVLREIADAVSQDLLSPRVLSQLRQSLNEDLSQLPESVKLTRESNRRYAQEILDLHQSGVGPRSSPRMMNLIHDFYQTNLFSIKEKEARNILSPVLPDTTRMALATESSSGMARQVGAFSRKLGDGKIELSLKNKNRLGQPDITRTFARMRIFDGKALFGAGGVSDYFSSLGGFDLDDKSLITPITYQDSSGMERIIFSISRQPTGFQENIFAKIDLSDADSLRGLFADKEDFMKSLSKMAEDPNADTGIRYLRDILEYDTKGKNNVAEKYKNELFEKYSKEGLTGNFFSGTTSDGVEEQILRVYKQMGRELTSVYDDDDRILRNIETYGDSALAKQQATDRGRILTAFDTAEETYFKDFFPKVKEELIKSLDQAESIVEKNLADSLRAAINSNDAGLVQSILDTNKSLPEIQALRSSAMLSVLGRGSTSEANLGKYINRAMAIGSTLNQFDDFLRALNSAGVSKEMKDFLTKETITIIPSETAIDKSISFSISNTFNARIVEGINRASSPEIAEAGLRILFAENLTIDGIGEKTMKELGRRIGKMTALSENLSFEEDLNPIIDKFYLQQGGKIGQGDQRHIVEGIQQALIESEDFLGSLGPRSARLKAAFDSPTFFEGDSNIFNFLSEEFGDSTGRYASASKVQGQTEAVQRMLGQIKKLGLGSISRDQIIAATETSEEAMTAAKIIIEKNKDKLAKVLETSKDSSEIEKIENTGKRMKMAQEILEDFDDAMKFMSSGISRQNLHDAIEKQSSRMGANFYSDNVNSVMKRHRGFYAIYRRSQSRKI